MDVFGQLEEGLGCRPSRFVQRTVEARALDLERVINARQEAWALAPTKEVGPKEIWPLISHHGFNPHGLFGIGQTGDLHNRALAILLAHHGIVASDPLVEVESLWFAGRRAESLKVFRAVIGQISKVEPLIDSDHLRFESSRPSFTDQSRKAILDVFHLSPDLEAFGNFEQAFPDVLRYRETNEQSYVEQVRELYGLMGLPCPSIVSAEQGRAAIHELATAFIHVSWQLAICSSSPGCDVTLTKEIEHRIFDVIIGVGTVAHPDDLRRQRGRTRHVKRLSIGDLPNLHATGLSSADAAALRRDDAFEAFRRELASAMDRLPDESTVSRGSDNADAEFEGRMQDAAARLRSEVRRRTFRQRVKHESLPMSVGFATTAGLSVPAGIEVGVTAGPLAAIVVILARWLKGRGSLQGNEVAIRYFSSLGGERPAT